MRRKQLGMTLVELLIVVVIVGILAGIAYPSYRRTVIKSNRTEAKVALNQAAQAMEKCFTRFGEYNNPGCLTYADILDGKMTETEKYRLTFSSITDVAFTLQATPQGGQAADTSCGYLRLNEGGKRAVERGEPKNCW